MSQPEQPSQPAPSTEPNRPTERANLAGATFRRLGDQQAVRSICGTRRDLLALEAEGQPLAFHYLSIHDSPKHYHKKTTEYYFVTAGRGQMQIEDETVDIEPGDFFVIPPGLRHMATPAEGVDLQILIIAHPPIDPKVDLDHYYD